MRRISCWRVFPFDGAAAPNEPFTPEYAGTPQGAGRFDVPDLTPVLYLAESPEHAVAEVLQGLRNQRLDDADLIRFGHRLALTEVTLEIAGGDEILPDLCDPIVLGRHGVRPDVLSSSDFAQTRAIARQLFAAKCWGFRWWSGLFGDWHTIVLFHMRLSPGAIHFGIPEPLTLRSDALLGAARRLAIQVSPNE